MSLNHGDRLGPYELLDRIGAGGMGEVYRARDPRLKRIVAIKVLKGTPDSDAERRKRFLQEARAASALNHSHIVSVFDIGTAADDTFLVMEYLPGQPLSQIIPPKGLPIAQAIGYGADIADALAAAHSAGIVHRDIKPGNVIVGPDEQLKVLDFGLTKLMEPAPGEFSETRTQESALTHAGTIVGTIAYMSPEQAAGHTVDHRTDIFSLGIVLYEMIAGQRPFQGKSQAELLNSIIHATPPPVSERNPALPIELEDIFAKALAKDPRQRYQHAGDLALDLRRLQSGLKTGQLPSMRASGSAPIRRRGWVLPIAVALALIVGLVSWWLRRLDTFWTNPMTEARITRLTDFEGDELDAAISQDGKVVAFLSDRDGPLDAWVTQVGSGNFVNLTKGRFPGLLDELAFGIGFSGDGTQLWVRGDASTAKTGSISMVPILGGLPRRFLDAVFQRRLVTRWSSYRVCHWRP
jgi:serine/threonine protein kinase